MDSNRRSFLGFVGALIPAWAGFWFLKPKQQLSNDDLYFLGFFQRTILDTFPFYGDISLKIDESFCVTARESTEVLRLNKERAKQALSGSLAEINAYRRVLHGMLASTFSKGRNMRAA